MPTSWNGDLVNRSCCLHFYKCMRFLVVLCPQDTFDIRICLARTEKFVLDFETAHETDLHNIDIPVTFNIHQSGTIHGLAFWFDVAFIGSQYVLLIILLEGSIWGIIEGVVNKLMWGPSICRCDILCGKWLYIRQQIYL